MNENINEIELVLAAFFDKDALLMPSHPLERIHHGGNRYYFTFDYDSQEISYYPSVTTITKLAMPMGYGLLKYMVDKGLDEAKSLMNERADFGTFLHICIERFLIEGFFDIDELYGAFLIYAEKVGRDRHFVQKHIEELKKDMLSFSLFCHERKLKLLAVEIPLKSDELGFCGTSDIVCEIDFNKTRIECIIDIKSGKNGFFPQHEAQLHLLKVLWNENFPDRKIEHVFNWCGTDWRTKPNYKLKNQTKSKEAAKIFSYINIAKVDIGDIGEKKMIPHISGLLKLGQYDPELIQIYTISEYIKLQKR